MREYLCINKIDSCGKCGGSTMCTNYENIKGESPFKMNRKTMEEIIIENENRNIQPAKSNM